MLICKRMYKVDEYTKMCKGIQMINRYVKKNLVNKGI